MPLRTDPDTSARPAAPAPHLVSVRPLWQRLLPLFILMPSIGAVLSGLITWINLGGADDFGARWLRAFATALPVMPLGLGLMVLMERWAGPRLRTLRSPLLAQVLLAALTACAMELLMATAVTLANRGPDAGFAAAWAKAFVGSLPAGFGIGLLMAFVVKPRLERWLRPA